MSEHRSFVAALVIAATFSATEFASAQPLEFDGFQKGRNFRGFATITVTVTGAPGTRFGVTWEQPLGVIVTSTGSVIPAAGTKTLTFAAAVPAVRQPDRLRIETVPPTVTQDEDLGRWVGVGVLRRTCVADVDADRDVDFADLINVLAAWGPTPPPPPFIPEDMDRNGRVGFFEILTLLTQWGRCR